MSYACVEIYTIVKREHLQYAGDQKKLSGLSKMKILITGGAGFIGSAVVRLAIEKGHSVVNVDALTYASCVENLASVQNDPKYSFEHADICDRLKIDKIFKKYKPDQIMHLAAESHVDRSIDDPTSFIETNINGTYQLLEAARTYWNEQSRPTGFRFLHISTDEVFGSLGDKGLFTEATPYDPRSPYSASKACSDHLVRAWHETYNLPILISNCSNNYGPYHFPEKLIPVVILNAIQNKPIPIYGDGKNIRDWLYVDDHAKALLLILEKGKVGQSYNVGGENELSNIELVNTVCELLDELKPRKSGTYKKLITFVHDRPGHDARYAIDPSKIRKELGWLPSVSIDQGLKNTILWYLENEAWWSAILQKHNIETRLGNKT